MVASLDAPAESPITTYFIGFSHRPLEPLLVGPVLPGGGISSLRPELSLRVECRCHLYPADADARWERHQLEHAYLPIRALRSGTERADRTRATSAEVEGSDGVGVGEACGAENR